MKGAWVIRVEHCMHDSKRYTVSFLLIVATTDCDRLMGGNAFHSLGNWECLTIYRGYRGERV